MSFEIQMHLLFLSELLSALKANDSGTFKRWLSGGIKDLGRPAVEELMLEWMTPYALVKSPTAWWVGIWRGVSSSTGGDCFTKYPCTG